MDWSTSPIARGSPLPFLLAKPAWRESFNSEAGQRAASAPRYATSASGWEPSSPLAPMSPPAYFPMASSSMSYGSPLYAFQPIPVLGMDAAAVHVSSGTPQSRPVDYVRALRSPPPGAAPQEGPQFRIAAQIGAATHPPVTISMKDMGRTLNDLFFEWFLRHQRQHGALPLDQLARCRICTAHGQGLELQAHGRDPLRRWFSGPGPHGIVVVIPTAGQRTPGDSPDTSPVAAASPTMNGISDSTAGHHIFVITLPGVAGDPVAIPVEGSLAGTTLQDLLKDWATRYPGHAGPAFAADGRLPPCSLSTGAGHPLALPADGAEPLARWFRGPGPHLLSLRLQPAPQPPAQDGPPAAETPAHATGVAGAASPASPLQPWGPDGGYWLASTAGPPVSLFATSDGPTHFSLSTSSSQGVGPAIPIVMRADLDNLTVKDLFFEWFLKHQRQRDPLPLERLLRSRLILGDGVMFDMQSHGSDALGQWFRGRGPHHIVLDVPDPRPPLAQSWGGPPPAYGLPPGPLYVEPAAAFSLSSSAYSLPGPYLLGPPPPSSASLPLSSTHPARLSATDRSLSPARFASPDRFPSPQAESPERARDSITDAIQAAHLACQETLAECETIRRIQVRAAERDAWHHLSRLHWHAEALCQLYDVEGCSRRLIMRQESSALYALQQAATRVIETADVLDQERAGRRAVRLAQGRDWRGLMNAYYSRVSDLLVVEEALHGLLATEHAARSSIEADELPGRFRLRASVAASGAERAWAAVRAACEGEEADARSAVLAAEAFGLSQLRAKEREAASRAATRLLEELKQENAAEDASGGKKGVAAAAAPAAVEAAPAAAEKAAEAAPAEAAAPAEGGGEAAVAAAAAPAAVEAAPAAAEKAAEAAPAEAAAPAEGGGEAAVAAAAAPAAVEAAPAAAPTTAAPIAALDDFHWHVLQDAASDMGEDLRCFQLLCSLRQDERATEVEANETGSADVLRKETKPELKPKAPEFAGDPTVLLAATLRLQRFCRVLNATRLRRQRAEQRRARRLLRAQEESVTVLQRFFSTELARRADSQSPPRTRAADGPPPGPGEALPSDTPAPGTGGPPPPAPPPGGATGGSQMSEAMTLCEDCVTTFRSDVSTLRLGSDAEGDLPLLAGPLGGSLRGGGPAEWSMKAEGLSPTSVPSLGESMQSPSAPTEPPPVVTPS